MRNSLSEKLENGFWFPVFVTFLRWTYERVSLGYRFKTWLGKTLKENPAGASELYQVFWLIGALLWLALVTISVPSLSQAWVRHTAAIIPAYRILEIGLFALHWVFVAEKETLHGIRRSIAGFLVNIFEIALLTSVLIILISCQDKGCSQWLVFYSNISAAFGLSLAQSAPPLICQIVVHVELILSGVLLSLVIASLIGGLLRKEKQEQESDI